MSTASVDITDADQVTTWLSRHIREGGRRYAESFTPQGLSKTDFW